MVKKHYFWRFEGGYSFSIDSRKLFFQETQFILICPISPQFWQGFLGQLSVSCPTYASKSWQIMQTFSDSIFDHIFLMEQHFQWLNQTERQSKIITSFAQWTKQNHPRTKTDTFVSFGSLNQNLRRFLQLKLYLFVMSCTVLLCSVCSAVASCWTRFCFEIWTLLCYIT